MRGVDLSHRRSIPQRWFILCSVLSVTLTLGAQDTDSWRSASVQVNVDAVVIESTIKIEMLSYLDVGEVQPSQRSVYVDPSVDQGAALVKMTGRPRASVQITYTEYMEMANPMNSSLMVEYLVNGNGWNNQVTSTVLHRNPVSIQLNNNGEYFLWIGCRFALEDVTTGQYDGEFVLEVEYN